MTTGLTDIERQPSQDEETCVAGASTADALRLLSAGATGAILMALGEGPLRTKSLTEQIPGYAPRTVYRYAGKLAELEVIEREEEPGVPSKVVHMLSEPCGSELYSLITRFADASMTRLPDGRIDAHAWASLGLLADLWEAGMIEELSCGPRSPTELARGPHELSYHQVNRRAGLFRTAKLVREHEAPGRRRCYALTDKTRKTMGLLAEIGRWRHRYVVGEDEEGMSAGEMATTLRAALPLARLPEHVGRRLKLCVIGEGDAPAAEGEVVWVEVREDGTLHSCSEPTERIDAWGRGKVEGWVQALVDGDSSKILAGEDDKLIGDCLGRLYEELWTPSPF